MCGIAGAFGSHPVDEEKIRACLRLMGQRGPDARGVHCEQVGANRVVLLHSRLAIIDLSQEADQPFDADDCTLVYNGEIYNYRELRADLEGLGHRFRTESDTEVIIKAYRAWETACVDRFEGMWAFALLDRKAGHLVLSRDRFGEKPLFYRIDRGQLYFGSEIKFVVSLGESAPDPDVDQLRRYLVNGYKSLYKRPRTFFRDIHEFPPASTAVVTDPTVIAAQRYWSLAFRPTQMSEDAALEETRARLRRAVELRMRADVPIAFCLSGGVDSSVLAAMVTRELRQDIATFSIVDDDPRYDESENIGQIVDALGCASTIVHAGSGDFFDRMETLVAYHDAPVATISYYVHSYLSELIARSGCKVAISGTGADEIFTGYYDHYTMWLADMRARPEFPGLVEDWRTGYGRAVRNPLLKDPCAFVRNPEMRTHIYDNAARFKPWMRDAFAEPFEETPYAEDLLRNRMMNELFHECVPVILKEDDLNSMMFSVENRSPYLDRPLVEFLFTVPSEYLIRNGCAKWLLRSAAKGLLPDGVIFDKRKRGFNASIDTLIDRKDRDTVDRLLEPSPIFDIVRRDAIEELISADLTDNSLSKFMFSFISSKLFLESRVLRASPKKSVTA